MIRIRDIFIALDENESILPERCASILGILPGEILSWQIHKKSIDARKKSDIRFVYTVDLEVADEDRVLKASCCCDSRGYMSVICATVANATRPSATRLGIQRDIAAIEHAMSR